MIRKFIAFPIGILGSGFLTISILLLWAHDAISGGDLLSQIDLKEPS